MDLNDLPSIDGVTWRMFRDGDYTELTRLLNEDLEVGGHSSLTSVESVQSGCKGLEGLEESTDILIAETGGSVIGQVTAATWKQLEGSQIGFHAGRVTPLWRRRGVGAGLLGWVQGRLAEMTAAASDPITRTVGVSEATREFLTRNGYEVTQHEAILVRPSLDDIPDAPLPDGLEVRPVDEADLRMIYEAEVEHFKDHWGARQERSEWWDSFHDDPNRDMTLWQIAFDGDQVVGIVRPHINEEENRQMGRKRGYTEDISTRREWRNKGVAAALIAAALQVQRDRGLEETALSVHVENPHGAYRLYERMGFRLHSQMDTLELGRR